MIRWCMVPEIWCVTNEQTDELTEKWHTEVGAPPNKASGPNSIPYRVLFLLKNDILNQLADLFNLYFMAGVFPSVLKTAEVNIVFKKDSKLDYSNYHPTSLLSNTEKILEKHMYKKLHLVQ